MTETTAIAWPRARLGSLLLGLFAAALPVRPAAAQILWDEPLTAEDTRLRAALDSPLPDSEQLASLRALEAELGTPEFERYLARAVHDTAAATFVRGNAVMQLGERGAAEHWSAFRAAATSPDPGVRVAAAVALAGVLPVRETDAIALLARLVDDRDKWVAAKALESLVDHDLDILRAYLAVDPLPEIEPVVRELILLGESRGAPLAPTDTASGTLVRELADGGRLEFRPVTRWPQWQAAVGTLTFSRPGRPPLVLGEEVEVVGNVLPAAVSPDGRQIALEVARQIRVIDIETGAQRDIGAGISPRPMPFSTDFLFFRPVPESSPTVPAGPESRLRYEVLRTGYGVGPSTSLGTLAVQASMGLRGNYSPVRWVRIRNYGERFILTGEGIEPFTLPDPFALSTVR